MKNLLSKVIAQIQVQAPNELKNTPTDIGAFVSGAIRILSWVVGVAAVVMIIVGGLMYITSAGDPNKTAKAKDTILYAVVGVIISLLAYAIVSFITGRFT